MRGSTKFLSTKKFKQIYPVKRAGPVATVTPKKQDNNESRAGLPATRKKTDPIVIFCRLPPLPPILGPLFVLSFLETLRSHDNNDDVK